MSLLCDPHTAPAVQCHIIDFSDHRRCFRVKDQMSFVLRVAHQAKSGCPPQNFPCLERVMRPASTFLEISRLYISFRIFLKGVMSIS